MKTEEREPHKEVKLSHMDSSSGIKVGLWANLFKRSFKTFVIDFPSLRVAVTVPKVFQNLHVAVRATHFPYSSVSSTRWNKSDLVLGGIFQLDILTLPPQAKQVKGWIMRQVTDAGREVEINTYPIGSALGYINLVAAQIKCSFVLPKVRGGEEEEKKRERGRSGEREREGGEGGNE